MAPRMSTQTLAVLALLMANPTDEWYGFELAERADIKTGTLYPLLARLERQGWLRSSWEDIDPRVAGRPRRRLYVLTPEGATAASEHLRARAARAAHGRRSSWFPAPERNPA